VTGTHGGDLLGVCHPLVILACGLDAGDSIGGYVCRTPDVAAAVAQVRAVRWVSPDRFLTSDLFISQWGTCSPWFVHMLFPAVRAVQDHVDGLFGVLLPSQSGDAFVVVHHQHR